MTVQTAVVVYDDRTTILPFTLTRPAIDLRCGVLRLWEKHGPVSSLVVAGRRQSVVQEREPNVPVNILPDAQRIRFHNGRALTGPLPRVDALEYVMRDEVGIHTVVVGRERAKPVFSALLAGYSVDGMLGALPVFDVPATWISAGWDIVNANGKEIKRDWEMLADSGEEGIVDPHAIILNPGSVRVAKGGKIEAGAIVDARHGPVWVGKGAVVHPMSYVEGPSAIGDGAQVMAGARIREGSTIGPYCRVGGEVEESVFLARSNKYHDGFVGHSVIGEWCNLGALTTTSDLKNTYGTIRVDFGEGAIDSGTIKLGTLMGDHVKTGIGTLLTSGAVIGPASNVFGGGLAPRTIPAFSWCDKESISRYDPDRFLSTADTAMARRNAALTPSERDLYLAIAGPSPI